MKTGDKTFLFNVMDCIGALIAEEDIAPAPTQISQPSDSSDTVVFHTDTFMSLLSRKINTFMLRTASPLR